MTVEPCSCVLVPAAMGCPVHGSPDTGETPDEGLDVERLAEAMQRQDTSTPHSSLDWHRARAKGVAAEYARLAAAEPTPG